MTRGCTCHDCGRLFLVDVLVPDSLWLRIGMPVEGGLLCGRCIADRIEALEEYGALSLSEVS